MSKEFNEWWDSNDVIENSPYEKDTPAFWAWWGWCAGWKAGIKEGMRREHAMWVLAKVGQEIEKDEYCPHGIRHERHCKSCECIEQAEMRGEL